MDLRRVVYGVAACLTPVAVAMPLAVAMLPPAPASAGTPPLSSIVITEALPGMVAAPPGPLNGPLTSATIDSYFGGTSGAANALRQAISSGSVNAYIRMWRNEPPNGAFVGVVAAQLPNAADASAALAGADQSAAGSQVGHFAVPGIPDATGVTLALSSQAGGVNEDMVMFAKGASLFDVVTGQVATPSSPGASQLNQSAAIQVAQQQAAQAPGPAVAPCQCGTESTAYEVGRYIGIAALIGAVVGLVVYLVRRNRRRPEQTPPWDLSPTGGGAPGAWGLAPPPPSGPGAARSGARAATAVLERPPENSKVDYHCAWCGSGVAVGAGAHDCGSRDRPANYCMRCGSLFADGAATCGSCGSPKLQ